MSFAQVDERGTFTGESKFRKTEYINLDPGQHVIRILDENSTKKYSHYINRVYVECLGQDCPICENNKKIIYEHGDEYKNVAGYSPKRERFYVNVLDKTQAKVCPNCGKETFNISLASCGTCNTALEAPKPLNKVRVLSSGPRLFEDLNVMISANRMEQTNDVADHRGYDYLLIVSGTGRDRTITPVPQFQGRVELLDTSGMELFDLDNCMISLDREELLALHSGVSLKDIFQLRKVEKEGVVDGVKAVANVVDANKVKEEVSASVDSILKA